MPGSNDSHNNRDKGIQIELLRTLTVQGSELLSLLVQDDVTRASIDIITAELKSLPVSISNGR